MKIIFLTLAVLLLPSSALACSCMQPNPSTVLQTIYDTDLIAKFNVRNVQEGDFRDNPERVSELTVLDIYKGNTSEKVITVREDLRNSCANYINEGTAIYALQTGMDGKWYLNQSCSAISMEGDFTKIKEGTYKDMTTLDAYQAYCGAQGGQWKPNEKHKPFCNLPTPDAGKICNESEECESYACLAELTESQRASLEEYNNIVDYAVTGACAPYWDWQGCTVSIHQRAQDGSPMKRNIFCKKEG